MDPTLRRPLIEIGDCDELFYQIDVNVRTQKIRLILSEARNEGVYY